MNSSKFKTGKVHDLNSAEETVRQVSYEEK
jgi:hypothetical protein